MRSLTTVLFKNKQKLILMESRNQGPLYYTNFVIIATNQSGTVAISQLAKNESAINLFKSTVP